MFVSGSAFATDDPNPPPLVPAVLYAGSVTNANVTDLFTTAAAPNVPPKPLKKIATISKAAQLVGIDDAITLGQNVLGVGTTLAPRDRIDATFLTKDGTVVAQATEVYRAGTGTLIDDH